MADSPPHKQLKKKTARFANTIFRLSGRQITLRFGTYEPVSITPYYSTIALDHLQ
jgi:hypothetical protein